MASLSPCNPPSLTSSLTSWTFEALASKVDWWWWGLGEKTSTSKHLTLCLFRKHALVINFRGKKSTLNVWAHNISEAYISKSFWLFNAAVDFFSTAQLKWFYQLKEIRSCQYQSELRNTFFRFYTLYWCKLVNKKENLIFFFAISHLVKYEHRLLEYFLVGTRIVLCIFWTQVK